ncbi:MAG: hypothetical protein ACOYYS_10300 [Chloroflexota bacterium]
MSMYQSLQERHQELLARREAGEDRQALGRAVREYIEQARSEAHTIPRPRERDQLRANLRFWGAFLYDETGVYPDTALPPASHPAPDDAGPGGRHIEAGNWLRWVPGMGIAIIALLLLLVVLVTRPRQQSGLPEAVETALATHEELSQIQNRVETMAAAPTITPLPPTGTPTVTPTPDPTDAIGNVVDSRLTAAAGTQAASAPTATLPPIIVSPPQGGQEGYPRIVLMATITHSANPAGCERAAIQVNFDLDTRELSGVPSENVASLAPQDFQVSIRPIGGSESQAATPNIKDNAAEVAAGKAASGTAYFVQLLQAGVTTSDAIVQFDAACNQNPIVTYQWQVLYSALSAEPERNTQLDLSWTLTTWGPAPQLSEHGATSWIATLDLSVSGADQNAVFWEYRGTQFEPLSANRLIVFGRGPCEPATAVVSVTSGGTSVIRELVLVSPLCSKQASTGPEDAEACIPQATVQEDAVCRNGPGTVYDVVTAYKTGQVLMLDGRDSAASWLWVLMPSSQRHCWIAAELLAIRCGVDDLPIEKAPPTPAGVPRAPTPTATLSPAPGETPGTASPG